ncbi:uncharacterized protein LOC130818749 [Amaranthus tricolor]|uniref:uncharacterized protein LOC130818749 n=1 Tax=Amaranthus tricolor TaxID=29722 RepID=UPI0025884E56|nr:uncharacterized protein LOC130818749 [Amaranthus tricolor]
MKISRKGGGINKKSGIRKPHPKHVGPKKKINKPKSNNKNKSKMEVELKKNIPEIQKPEKPPTKSKLITSQHLSPSEHRSFFIHQFESANDTKLSSLELESIQESYFVKLSEGVNQESGNLGQHIKGMFASSWKKVLCDSQLVEGKVEPGSPSVLVISASALRSLEMLRGLRILTKECQAVKLFSKHIKIDDQVALLKNRVNIACGTPSRIKKLCEMEALGLSRLDIVVLDMHTDVKGFSLLTLRQVRDEFWDLYKTYIHQQLLQGNLCVCLYGPIPIDSGGSAKTSEDQ